MKKKFALLLLFYITGLTGQNKRAIDSLNALYEKADDNYRGDSLRVMVLGNLFLEYLNADLTTAKQYANQQVELAKKINYKRGLSAGIMNLGVIARQEGNYAEALNQYLKCFELKDHLGPALTGLYVNMAIVYQDMNDPAKALEYDLKALYYYRKTMDTTLAESKKTITILYNNLGYDYYLTGNYKLSNSYYAATIAKALGENDKESIAVSYNNIGTNHLVQKQYGPALEAFNISLKYAEEIGSKQDIAEANIGIAQLFTEQNKFQEAIDHLERALVNSVSTGDKAQQLLIYKKAAIAFGGMKDFKNKSYYLSRYNELNDSIYNKEKAILISGNFAKFEARDKEKDNIILTKQNRIQALEISRKNYLLVGFVILALIIVFAAWLVLRQNKIRAEQVAIQLEQKLLRSQMNPHFIFNSLTTIESFIYENQPKEAGRYLSDFARLMRLILENSASEYISLEKEIKTLEYYLSLQKLRLENNLNYILEVDLNGGQAGENLIPEDVMVPPMLTQPFIENAIEHGIRGSKDPGTIQIRFSASETDLIVEVSDNGIGINKAMQNKEKNSKHRSMAMQITKERLSVLNRSKKHKLTFKVEDISDGTANTTGTKVTFSIPL
jgi:tetratricopeptide (TPR) repeat protein